MGRTTIGQVFTLVKKYARLVICNNSGLLHIASVLGAPTVSYADPQENLLRWGPYPNAKKHILLQDEIDRKVTVEEFLKAVLDQLNEEKETPQNLSYKQ